MNDPDYWKRHYVLESDAEEMARHIRRTGFVSADRRFELVTFEQARDAPNVLISQGTAGHAYVFAELAYVMHGRGYNVFSSWRGRTCGSSSRARARASTARR